MPLETELEAIRTGAAIIPLTDRAFLRITGSDATRWLNGMVTNSIQSLQPGEGNYNFLLSAQGRIQGDCFIYREPETDDAFLLESDASQIPSIHQLLDKFIIMDDVELTESTDFESGILLLGPQAFTAIESLGLPSVPPNTLRISETSDGPVAILTTASTDRLELWTDEQQLAAIRKKLDLPELTAIDLEAHRILSGTPKFGTDIRDRDLPQETNQTHALHFNKGCYLGQEIVERIRSRGQVHRVFTQLTLTGATPTELPAPIEATLAGQTRPAGEITSITPSGPNTFAALGYLRREFATAPLTYPGGTAIPTTKL